MASLGLGYNFTHDTAGQRCTMTGTAVSRAYQWTADGNLAQMSDSGNQSFTTTFAYDHAGQRWRRFHGRTLTWYLDDMVELSNDQGLVEYSPLPGARCEVAENSEVKCHLKDQLSSVMTVDGDGAVLNKSTYLPYGKRVLLQGSTPGVFGFNDKREESQGDLVYYGARYYDPVVRQFISPDPLRLQGADDVLDGNSLQPYVYAAANPTSNAEVDGQWPAAVVRLFSSLAGTAGRLVGAGARVSARAASVSPRAAGLAARIGGGVGGMGASIRAGWEAASSAQKAFLLTEAAAAMLDDPALPPLSLAGAAMRQASEVLFAEEIDGSGDRGRSSRSGGEILEGDSWGKKHCPPPSADPSAREKGMRWRAGDDAQQQYSDILTAQRRNRAAIRSVVKSRTRADTELKQRYRSTKDIIEDE